MQQILNNWFVKWVLAPFLMLGALGWSYFQINYPTIHFHFKMTVEVQTPVGIKSSSVVNEFTTTFSLIGKEFMPSVGGAVTNGEALFIDLGSGKNLVVTLFSDLTRGETPSSHEMFNINSDVFCKRSAPNCMIYAPEFRKALIAARLSGPFELNVSELPELVTLTEVSDYKTMRRLVPTQIDTVLGSGYAIKSAKVEITDEPLTEQILHYLPWLAQHAKDKGSFDGTSYVGPKSPVLSSIGYSSFKWKY